VDEYIAIVIITSSLATIFLVLGVNFTFAIDAFLHC
jgi:hypothetical protein